MPCNLYGPNDNYDLKTSHFFPALIVKALAAKKNKKNELTLWGSGKPQFGKIKFRKDEIKNLYPSIAKAKKILNWTPKVKINLGLKKTINYYKKNG